MQIYDDKNSPYFRHIRREIEPALPPLCGRLLELGCGAGATLNWLRHRAGTEHTTGIEIFEDAATTARAHADEIHCLDFEQGSMPDDIAPFDTILCLDVLEHMVDPWQALDRLVRRHLKPGGTLVVTLPNIRHHTVLLPLLFKGHWQYEQAGIMDRTHLRFFTRQTALTLLAHPELTPVKCTALSFAENRLKRILNRATFGVFEGLLAPQYLLSARRTITTPN